MTAVYTDELFSKAYLSCHIISLTPQSHNQSVNSEAIKLCRFIDDVSHGVRLTPCRCGNKCAADTSELWALEDPVNIGLMIIFIHHQMVE